MDQVCMRKPVNSTWRGLSRKDGRYIAEDRRSSWVKIKNPQYVQNRRSRRTVRASFLIFRLFFYESQLCLIKLRYKSVTEIDFVFREQFEAVCVWNDPDNSPVPHVFRHERSDSFDTIADFEFRHVSSSLLQVRNAAPSYLPKIETAN